MHLNVLSDIASMLRKMFDNHISGHQRFEHPLYEPWNLVLTTTAIMLSTPKIIASSSPQYFIIEEYYTSKNTNLDASIVADAGDMSHISNTTSSHKAQDDEDFLLFPDEIDTFQSPTTGGSLFATSTPPGNHSPVPDVLGALSYRHVVPDFMFFTMTEIPEPNGIMIPYKIVRLIIEAKPLDCDDEKEEQPENKAYENAFLRMRNQIKKQLKFALTEYAWADLDVIYVLLVVGERFRLMKLSPPLGWTRDQELQDPNIVQVGLKGDSDAGIPLLIFYEEKWMINEQWRAAWALILAQECSHNSEFKENLQWLA